MSTYFILLIVLPSAPARRSAWLSSTSTAAIRRGSSTSRQAKFALGPRGCYHFYSDIVPKRAGTLLSLSLTHRLTQRAFARQGQAFQSQPVGHQTQFFAERAGHFHDVIAWLEMGGVDQQARGGAVGL